MSDGKRPVRVVATIQGSVSLNTAPNVSYNFLIEQPYDGGYAWEYMPPQGGDVVQSAWSDLSIAEAMNGLIESIVRNTEDNR